MCLYRNSSFKTLHMDKTFWNVKLSMSREKHRGCGHVTRRPRNTKALYMHALSCGRIIKLGCVTWLTSFASFLVSFNAGKLLDRFGSRVSSFSFVSWSFFTSFYNLRSTKHEYVSSIQTPSENQLKLNKNDTNSSGENMCILQYIIHQRYSLSYFKKIIAWSSKEEMKT